MTSRAVAACVVGAIACGAASIARPAAQAGPAQGARDARPAPSGTGVIAGVLVAADSGRPVRRARVSVNGGDPSTSRSVTTDDQGRFSFTDLPIGAFNLTASRPGFLDSIFGQKRPGSGRPGTPIQLGAGQRLDRVTCQIARGGVITGVILDEQGEPAFGTQVRALRYVMRTGERVLEAAGTGQADDRGVYRIPALPPGDYVVMATPRDQAGASEMAMVAKMKMEVAVVAASSSPAGAQALEDMKRALGNMATSDPANDPTSGYAPVFYPGTTQAASASSVTLDISEEKPAIDVPLQLVPMTRVSGSVIAADGQIPPSVQVMLIDAAQSLPGLDSRSARTGPDGRFSFASVPPGQYTVVARAVTGQVAIRLPSAPGGVALAKVGGPGVEQHMTWAVADVATDGRSAPNVVLTLQPGMSVSGQVAFDGPSPPPDLSRVRVTLQPVGQAGPAAELGSTLPPMPIDADGRFSFSGAVPGRYRLALASNIGLGSWFLRSSAVKGQDSLDFPFEVKPNENVAGALLTFGNRSTLLTGTLRDGAGQPTSDYTVIVFAAESRYWTPQSRRIQSTRPATDGRFAIRNLPPGEYRLIAVNDAEPGQWFDPAWLRQTFAMSIPVSLADGEQKTQDARVK
jgi:hypothetical protein